MEIELGSEYVGIPVVRSPFVDNSEGSGRTGITPSDIAYCSNDVRCRTSQVKLTAQVFLRSFRTFLFLEQYLHQGTVPILAEAGETLT